MLSANDGISIETEGTDQTEVGDAIEEANKAIELATNPSKKPHLQDKKFIVMDTYIYKIVDLCVYMITYQAQSRRFSPKRMFFSVCGLQTNIRKDNT